MYFYHTHYLIKDVRTHITSHRFSNSMAMVVFPMNMSIQFSNSGSTQKDKMMNNMLIITVKTLMK